MKRLLISLGLILLAVPAYATTQTLSTTFSFDGDNGGTASSAAVKYEASGDWVKVTVPAGILAGVTGAGGPGCPGDVGCPTVATTTLTANTALGAGYHPATVQGFTWEGTEANGLVVGPPGYGEVSTSGVITLYTTVGHAPWSPGADQSNCGVGKAFTFWYYAGS